MTPSTWMLAEVRQVVADWMHDAALQCPPDTYYGKRCALRHIWPTSLEAMIGRNTSSEQQFYVTGWDVSNTGIGLLCRHKLEIGSIVWLRRCDAPAHQTWVPATVVHTTLSVAGYRLGVEFILDDETILEEDAHAS